MGEEEATMRGRIVEAIGDAIAKTWNSTDPEVASLPPIDLIGSERDFLASSALDAALDMLVSETMAQFDEQIAAYEAKKDQAWNADLQERFDRFENYRDAADHMRGQIDDMLATLRSPRNG